LVAKVDGFVSFGPVGAVFGLAEQIQAEYNNGVLSINLPKRVEEKKKAGREITVA